MMDELVDFLQDKQLFDPLLESLVLLLVVVIAIGVLRRFLKRTPEAEEE